MPLSPLSSASSMSFSPSPSREADRLLALARDLDERVREVLLGVVVHALALVAALDDDGGPGALHVELVGPGRAGDGVHELRLHVRRERLVVLDAVDARAALHVRGALEIHDAHVVLEALRRPSSSGRTGCSAGSW